MKAAQILVGGTYLAKVSGRIVPLRVLAAGEAWSGPVATRRVRQPEIKPVQA